MAVAALTMLRFSSAAAALAAILLLPAATAVATATPEGCGDEQSCAAEEAPRSGGSLIQTQTAAPADKPAAAAHDAELGLLQSGSSSAGKVSPMSLKGRTEAVEKELDSLEQRVATLEANVGNAVPGEAVIIPSEPAPAPPPATPAPTPAVEEIPEEAVFAQRKKGGQLSAAMKSKAAQAARARKAAAAAAAESDSDDDSWLYPEGQPKGKEDLALLAERKERFRRRAGSLKDRVIDAEKRATTLRSKTIGLENAISGGKAPDSAVEPVSGADLKHRLMSLEDVCDDLRTRATSLEHAVMG